MSTPPLSRLVGLDALRGIAAVCVVAGHVLHYSDMPSGKSYLAVDFFIMLSGYVMARTYEGRMAAGLSTWSFFKMRYRRLWATVALGSFIGLIVTPGLSVLQMICGFLLVPLYVPGLSFPLNPVAWSTALELALNALHPKALAIVHSRALLLASASAALSTIPLLAPGHGLEGGPSGAQFGFAFLRGLISYPLGIVLWRTWQDRAPMTVPAWLTVSMMPVLFIASQQIPLPLVLLDYVFILAACPLLIAGGLQFKPSWGAFLGEMSFPLYAVHYPLILVALRLSLPAWVGGMAAVALTAGYVALAPRRKRAVTASPVPVSAQP